MGLALEEDEQNLEDEEQELEDEEQEEVLETQLEQDSLGMLALSGSSDVGSIGSLGILFKDYLSCNREERSVVVGECR